MLHDMEHKVQPCRLGAIQMAACMNESHSSRLSEVCMCSCSHPCMSHANISHKIMHGGKV